MQKIDFREITHKIDIFNVSEEAKLIHKKVEDLLADKSKVFEALFGNRQTDSYSDVQNSILIIEGEANLLYAILYKFKDATNLKWTLLNSALLNNWLVVHQIEEIHFENEKKKKEDKIENQKQSQRDYLAFSNELKKEILQYNIDTQTLLKSIENSIHDFTYKDKINKELHEELQSYKAGLREEFIKPILKSIIREYDRSNQQFEFYSQKAGTETQSELCAKLLKEFNVVSLGLLDILEDYNVAPFKVNENDEFSSREHKILKVIETDDVSKDGKIEKCVKCGFRDTENGRLLRQAEVCIYKFNNNK